VRRVKNLTSWEIWAFIAGRVLAAFGLGILAVQYFPQASLPLGLPTLIAGIVLLAFAAKGLMRKPVSKG